MSAKPHPATLGEYVRQEREKAGLSQRQLAAKVGRHHSQIARLERNEIGDRLAAEYMQGIADGLNVNVNKLLRYLGVKPETEPLAPRMYFRRAYGVNADEAAVLANLVEDYLAQHPTTTNSKGGTPHERNHEPHRPD